MHRRHRVGPARYLRFRAVPRVVGPHAVPALCAITPLRFFVMSQSSGTGLQTSPGNLWATPGGGEPGPSQMVSHWTKVCGTPGGYTVSGSPGTWGLDAAL